MSMTKYLAQRSDTAAKGTIKFLSNRLTSIETEGYGNKALGGLAISQESNEQAMNEINDVAESLRSLIEEKAENSGFSFEAHQIDAAVVGGLVANDPVALYTQALNTPSGSVATLRQGSVDGPSASHFSMESYNDSDIRTFQKATVMFNLLASGQDDFNKTFFPALTIAPTESGITLPATISLVFNDYVRSTSGAISDVGRKNVVRAFVNPEVLTNHTAEVVPVLRTSGDDPSEKYFVDTNLIEPHTRNLGAGITAQTSALKVDVEMDLTAIAQTDKSLNNGVADFTDEIAPAVRLKNVYIQFGADVMKVRTNELVGSQFVPSQQGDDKRVDLIFDTTSAIIRKDTLNVKGAELDASNQLLKDHNIRLAFDMSGFVLLDRGITRVSKGTVKLVSATDANGQTPGEAVLKQIATIVEKSVILGYDLDAYKENLNLRENGLLTESKTYNLLIQVPYRNPISSVASTYRGQLDVDTSLTNLVNLNHLAASAAGVGRVLEVLDIMRNYVHIQDHEGGLPSLDAFASYWVIPYFYEETIKAASLVDGTRSANRAEDIKGALMEYIHVVAMNMIEKSEYLSAAKALTGNKDFKPTVIVGTDLVLHSYFTGKFGTDIKRDEYDVTFTHTVDKRMRGKIVITLGEAQGSNNGNINPLSFGNFVHSAELVSNQNISKNGQHSRYLTVTPRYIHTWNLPIVAVINVTDVAELARKLQYRVDIVGEVAVKK